MANTLSEDIRNFRGGIYSNPYQGKDKKVVFVCSMGILRSATAARIYARKYNTRSAGTWPDALVPLTESLIIWADELVFVNVENYIHAQVMCMNMDNSALYNTMEEKATVLNIPDNYEHMHPKLVEAFEGQYERISG